MARVVFMGTPDFAATVLQAIIDAGHEVVGVVTQPDKPAGRNKRLRPPPVKQLALEHGLRVEQPRRVRKGRLAALLAGMNADVAVVAAYGRIIPPRALRTPRLGCVNVHASLLPRHRGAAPIHRSILAGDAETGVAIMQMDDGLDTGPVFCARATSIGPDDTASTLHDRLAELGGALLVDALPGILSGELVAEPQDGALATLAPPLEKSEGHVDWTSPAAAVANRVRGLFPWPGAFTFVEGRRLKLFPPLEVLDTAGAEGSSPAPGALLAVEPDHLDVACGEGAVRVRELQPENRRRMPVAAFLNGHALKPGDQLGS